jgi:tripartite-type tricarboxylate transporter receptor subunit TctC
MAGEPDRAHWNNATRGVILRGTMLGERAVKSLKPISLGVVLLASTATITRGEDVEAFYKGKTLFALVGVSAGGEYDFQLRLVAKHIGRFIPGHPAVVAQNMVGATGMVMANYLYRVAPKDGTYIGLIQNGLPTSQSVGMEGVQFDASKFNWIGSIAPTAETITTWKTTGVKTIEDAKKSEVIVGAVGSSGITISFPLMLNDLAGTKFKIVAGYTGSGALDLAMERGEISARANAWSSLKASKPDWIARKDVNIIVNSGPNQPDLADVPSMEDVVTKPADREVVDIVTAGDRLGHPFAMAPGVPAERVEAMRNAFADMLKDEEFRKDAAAAKLDIDAVGADALLAAAQAALNASPDAKVRARKYFQ